jgi:outer membrane receptor protein involved in Fe transport
LDLRLEKEFKLGEKTRLKFMLDVWNLFNTDYYYWVASTDAESSAYLAPGGYVMPRRGQLSARIVF